MIPQDRRAGALVQRLAALLCFAGAGLFGLAAAFVSRLDHVRGAALYRLPGGAALDPAALKVLLACAGLLALLGVAAVLFAPRIVSIVHPKPAQHRRPVLVLIVGLAALLTVLAARELGF